MGRDELLRISQRSQKKGKTTLNVAAVTSATRALGPGLRAAVWVQGCSIHCPGCIAPDWIAMRPAFLIDPELLAEELLRNPAITGLTLSGGEPMLQAGELARLVRHARRQRDIDVISFTGFRLASLLRNPPNPGVESLLQELDVLIDGPYLDQKNDNLGLRGSSNQQIHFFTGKLQSYDFHQASRSVEIEVSDGQAFMIGIPTRSLHRTFARAVEQARQVPTWGVHHERA